MSRQGGPLDKPPGDRGVEGLAVGDPFGDGAHDWVDGVGGGLAGLENGDGLADAAAENTSAGA